jgi:hypothetical protein
MYVGDKKNPIAFGTKMELLSNLDSEFCYLLDDALNHLSGFKKISADNLDLSESYIIATRYLVLELMREYGSSGQF